MKMTFQPKKRQVEKNYQLRPQFCGLFFFYDGFWKDNFT